MTLEAHDIDIAARLRTPTRAYAIAKVAARLHACRASSTHFTNATKYALPFDAEQQLQNEAMNSGYTTFLLSRGRNLCTVYQSPSRI
jgi:hypothetical protein